MLTKPTLEELLERTENRYTLACVVSRRARQLVEGGQPLVDRNSVGSNNIVSVSAEEISQDKVAAIPGIHEPYLPLRRDVREKLLEAERLAEAEMLGLDDMVNPTRPALTDAEIEDIKDRGRVNVIQRLSPDEATFAVPDPQSDAIGSEPASPLAYDLLAAVERIGGYDAVEEDDIDLEDLLDLDHFADEDEDDDFAEDFSDEEFADDVDLDLGIIEDDEEDLDV